MDEIRNLFDEAVSKEKKGNRAEAFNLYSQFIDVTERRITIDNNKSLKDKLALAYNNRGLLRYLSVDFDEAIKDYTFSLTFDPGLAVAFYNRGTIHYRLSRFDEAISDMKAALALNPAFEEAKIGLDKSLRDKHEKQNRGW